MELKNLKTIIMEQLLRLKKIYNYAFKGLQSLESVTLKYLPRFRDFQPKVGCMPVSKFINLLKLLEGIQLFLKSELANSD